MCGCASVSAENLEKSLRQMEKQLVQLERDLETFSSPDDPNDMFFTKMAISFTPMHTHTYAHKHTFNKYSTYFQNFFLVLRTVVNRRME